MPRVAWAGDSVAPTTDEIAAPARPDAPPSEPPAAGDPDADAPEVDTSDGEPAAPAEADADGAPEAAEPLESEPAEDGAGALSVHPRAAADDTQKKTRAGVTAPSAAAVRSAPTKLAVGVGLAPSAPGSKTERALVRALQRSIEASTDPVAKVRHVSAGAGEARLVCRERRDDFVVMIGYIADRPDPVVLAHDCRLDRSLAIRSEAAARSNGLLAALWDEHETLVRQGVRERRTLRRLSPTARGVIIASVAVAVVGTAVGILVANALREDKVVITVSP